MAEKKFIDADWLTRKIFPFGMVADGNYPINAKSIKMAIDNALSVDVVEVVRCKDCKRAEMYNFYGEDVPRLACVEKKNGEVCFATEVEQNHFCSYGERKEQT